MIQIIVQGQKLRSVSVLPLVSLRVQGQKLRSVTIGQSQSPGAEAEVSSHMWSVSESRGRS